MAEASAMFRKRTKSFAKTVESLGLPKIKPSMVQLLAVLADNQSMSVASISRHLWITPQGTGVLVALSEELDW